MGPRFVHLLLCLVPLSVSAQWGLVSSNYAGTDAVPLNPARMTGQRQFLDVNFIGFSAFAWNDHVYLARSRNSLWGELRQGLRGNADQLVFSSALGDADRSAFATTSVKGPAFSLSLGRGAVGAHVGARVHGSATGVPGYLARGLMDGLGPASADGVRYGSGPMNAATAAWSEIGISYAHILYKQGYSLFSAGATVKRLFAHQGSALAVDQLDYTVHDSASATVHAAQGRYLFAMPAFNSGSGWGADVGFTFERTLDEVDRYVPHEPSLGCGPMPYRYRIGISLLDLGGMRFRNAYTGSFDATDLAVPDYNALGAEGAEGLDSLMQGLFNAHSSSGATSIGLPTAASLQFDLRVRGPFHVAITTRQRVTPGNTYRLRRSNAVAVAPRFETKRFEVALPVVIHEYRWSRPSVGLMLRMNNVIIGSDHIVPFISRVDVYTMDFYVRVKWTIFRGAACKGKGRKAEEYAPGDTGALPCVDPK